MNRGTPIYIMHSTKKRWDQLRRGRDIGEPASPLNSHMLHLKPIIMHRLI